MSSTGLQVWFARAGNGRQEPEVSDAALNQHQLSIGHFDPQRSIWHPCHDMRWRTKMRIDTCY